jgi:hypothetical protein
LRPTGDPRELQVPAALDAASPQYKVANRGSPAGFGGKQRQTLLLQILYGQDLKEFPGKPRGAAGGARGLRVRCRNCDG